MKQIIGKEGEGNNEGRGDTNNDRISKVDGQGEGKVEDEGKAGINEKPGADIRTLGHAELPHERAERSVATTEGAALVDE